MERKVGFMGPKSAKPNPTYREVSHLITVLPILENFDVRCAPAQQDM